MELKPGLEIRMLGPMTVHWEGEALPRLRSRTSAWTLALLALRVGRDVPRDWLATQLWPDSPADLGLYNLRRCLLDLRKALGSGAQFLETPTRSALRLRQSGVFVDVEAFRAATDASDEDGLELALDLYAGPLLEGCTDEWAVSERADLHRRHLDALERLAARIEKSGEHARAVRLWRRAVAAEPYHEAYHRSLMAALTACGDHAAVTQVFRDLRVTLHRDLNAQPSAETVTFHQSLVEKRSVPPPATVPTERPPFPRPLTRLIGRATEMAQIDTWLGEHRFVTLVGAGGVGKTRLAIAAAERAGSTLSAGPWFVALAEVADPEGVDSTVCAAVGVPVAGEIDPVARLTNWLRGREGLLVLDNCEHVLDAVAALAERVLETCPGVRLLATSQERLSVAGEWVYRVPSLELPTESSEPWELEAISECAAVALFVERARMADPDFAFDPVSAPPVVRLCRRLDGIPLAIELAAARVAGLSVAQIEAQMDDRFTLLTGGGRTAPSRHRSLRAMVEWSHDRLSDEERIVFRRVSVFRNPWSVDGAVRVVGGEPAAVAATVASLVDKSLIARSDRNGTAGYLLMETLRQFGAECLEAAGEAPAVRARHRRWFLELVETNPVSASGSGQGPALAAIDRVRGDVFVAIDSAKEDGDRDAELRFGAALAGYWMIRGDFKEGRARLEAAATWEGAPALRARVLANAGQFAAWVGQTDLARKHFLEALQIERENGNRSAVANLVNALGLAASAESDFAGAWPMLQESLDIQRELGNRSGIAIALNSLGLVAWYQGRLDEARTLHQKSLEIKRAADNRSGISFSLTNLGLVALSEGDLDTAEGLLLESLLLRTELGFRWGIADTSNHLGVVAWHRNELDLAFERHSASLEIQSELNNQGGIAQSERNLALVAVARGEVVEASRLLSRSVEVLRGQRDRRALAYCLEAQALVHARSGDSAEAESRWRAAQSVRRDIGAPLPAIDHASYLRVAPMLARFVPMEAGRPVRKGKP